MSEKFSSKTNPPPPPNIFLHLIIYLIITFNNWQKTCSFIHFYFYLLLLYPFSRYLHIVCLFWGFYVTLENISLIWRRHQFRWMAGWKFLIGAHGHWAVYGGTGNPFIKVISEHPWHTPVTERLAVELSLLKSVAAWIRTPNLPLAGRTF